MPPRRRMGAGPLTTLAEMRRWLEEHRPRPGADCPVCGQPDVIYDRRQISGAIARLLIEARKRYEQEWFHRPTGIKTPGGEIAKLEYWGLMERWTRDRDPEGPGAGYWRVTLAGVMFADDHCRVPRDAVVHHNRVLKLSDERGTVGIRDVVGKKFDYDDLMGRDYG
jgi:hypothetical protein